MLAPIGTPLKFNVEPRNLRILKEMHLPKHIFGAFMVAVFSLLEPTQVRGSTIAREQLHLHASDELNVGSV